MSRPVQAVRLTRAQRRRRRILGRIIQVAADWMVTLVGMTFLAVTTYVVFVLFLAL